MRPIIFLVATTILLTKTSFASPESLCDIADLAIKEASSIRGLSLKRKVPCLTQNKEEVRKYIIDALKTKVPEEKIRNEEIVYKKVGFIPESYDYKNGLVDLYVSQLGGYYDPEKHHYVMAAWMPAMLQMPVAVHELTHALQDQYYDLKSFIDEDKGTSDELLARSALVEGDATAVMLDYSRKLVGQIGIGTEKNVESIMLQNVLGSGMMSGMSGTPQSLQLSLIFPYTSGLRFVHTLLLLGGYHKVDDAFRKVPRSTEEILHPDKYLSGAKDFIDIKDEDAYPEDVDGQGGQSTWKKLYSDKLGEFSISALLSMYIQDKSKVANAAAGWGGDKIALWESSDNKRYALVWKFHWDTAKDNEEFSTLFNEALKQQFTRDNTISFRTQDQETTFVRIW